MKDSSVFGTNTIPIFFIMSEFKIIFQLFAGICRLFCQGSCILLAFCWHRQPAVISHPVRHLFLSRNFLIYVVLCQNNIFRNTQHLEDLKSQMNWDQKALEAWLEESARKDEDALTLQKYTRSDEGKVKVIKVLL